MKIENATKADIDQLTELRIALALWIRKVNIKKWCWNLEKSYWMKISTQFLRAPGSTFTVVFEG